MSSIARRLAQQLGADEEVVEAAALLHDFVQIPKNHPDRSRAPEISALEAETVLRECGFPEAKIAPTLRAIAEHGWSAGRPASSLESGILQDADRLDALGAIGVLRTVSCGTEMGSRLYHLAEPFARTRPLDDKRHVLDHFYVKLLHLADQLNTEPARAEGQRRSRFMREFLEQLSTEI